jgi:hypothetical protein
MPTELDKFCGYIFELGAIDLGAELGAAASAGSSAPRSMAPRCVNSAP